MKLASARDFRAYGPRAARSRAEYINAGLYLFATILLLGGFVAQLSREAKSGLALIVLAAALILIVNVHDLFAHLAGIDYRLPLLAQYDVQLLFVEFAVPFLQAIGSLLLLLGTLFLLIQVRINNLIPVDSFCNMSYSDQDFEVISKCEDYPYKPLYNTTMLGAKIVLAN